MSTIFPLFLEGLSSCYTTQFTFGGSEVVTKYTFNYLQRHLQRQIQQNKIMPWYVPIKLEPVSSTNNQIKEINFLNDFSLLRKYPVGRHFEQH